MAIRNIRKMGDEVLRKPSKEIKEMTSRTMLLIEDMFDTMYEAYGVGLAAPQVGILKRLVVIDTYEGQPLVLTILRLWKKTANRSEIGMSEPSGEGRSRKASEPCGM